MARLLMSEHLTRRSLNTEEDCLEARDVSSYVRSVGRVGRTHRVLQLGNVMVQPDQEILRQFPKFVVFTPGGRFKWPVHSRLGKQQTCGRQAVG
jgi:hypothetical protein